MWLDAGLGTLSGSHWVNGRVGDGTVGEQGRELSNILVKLRLLGGAALEMNKISAVGDGQGQEQVARILRLALQALSLERVAVLTCESNSSDLVVRAQIGYGDVVGKVIPAGQGICGTVFLSGRPEAVGDVRGDGRYVAGLQGGRSEMAAPLKLDDRVIGVLDAESPELDAFDDVDLEIFSLFAAQAATALHNAEQRTKMEQRIGRLVLLNRASQAIESITDEQELLDRLISLACEALSLQRVALVLPATAAAGALEVRAAVGYPGAVGKHIPLGQGISGSVFRSGRAEVVGDVTRDARYVEGIEGGRSEMAVPLRDASGVVGVLDAESPLPNAFDESDVELFQAFANHAATALRNARFTEALRMRARRLSLLNQASRTVTTVLDLEAVLDRILELTSGALHFERCAVVMPEPGGELVVRAARGYGDAVGRRIPRGGGISGTVFETAQAERIDDVRRDPRYIAGAEDARSEMAAPMIVEREVIGVLDAESPDVAAYDDEDLEVFCAFAAQAAAAVRNARSFRAMEDANTMLKANLLEMERLNRELEAYTKQVSTARDSLDRQVKQLTALHHAGQAVVSSLDLDTTLEQIVKMTQEIVDSSSTTIKLIDRETEELRIKVRVGKEGDDEDMARLDVPLRVGDKTIGMFELASARGYGSEERQLLETIAAQAAIAIENARLFEDTQRTYYDTLRSLAGALEARDSYTRGHSQRVADLALELATELDVPEEERREIYSAALLHDIGKIGVRDEVLLKQGALSGDEMEAIRRHPIFGDAILAPLKFLGRVTGMVKHHHERWDGDGYPDGLAGDAIPRASRIVAVSDTYDALTSDRPYRSRRSHDEAMEVILAERGKQFDPTIVKALEAVMRKRSAAEA